MNKSNAVYRHLMSGVSYFIPFIVAGGVLISFAFLIDAGNASTPTFGATNPVSAWLLNIGVLAISMMLPILGGYIAYSIADRPGLLPGIVVGLLAREGGSGFIGAIAGGFLAGYLVLGLRTLLKGLPRSFEGAKTLIIYPVIGTILVALGMIGINYLVIPINTAMTSFLQNLSTGNAVLLGAVIGAMVAFDMGGPVNKAAYLFCVATLTAPDGSTVASPAMGMVGAAGFTISTSCALATFLFPKKFSEELRDAGKAALVMGVSFIAEGAIPFVIARPKQVLPSIMTGSAVAGALAGLAGITLTAPIGGIFTIPLVNNIGLYLLISVFGTFVSALMMGFMLKPHVDVEEMEDAVA
ncbi:MAG: PTS fructose transporter subunit IIC [Bacteroidetes bacterium]|nr:PTS fructose transporter subunit IIC [Bacteroidota bacterium]